VLVVDDDTKILSYIQASLKLASLDVVIATGGEEAISLAALNKPGIMLLDILMELMDGFEVLRSLRGFSDLPVIVMSAQASAVEKALSLGANDFLEKPFRPDELIKKIRTLLDTK
jgi:two-component system, OmpR family, KDP operon response regulator KdpE